MSTIKVLVSDKLSERGLDVLRQADGVEVEFRPGLSEDELCEIIGEYDGLIIRSATKVTPKVVDAADSLRAVGRAGIGVDNIDIPAASRRGIVVMNTPTGNSVTTAEHAISLMMSLARKIPNAVGSMRGGKWEKSKFQGREITGKTLGVVGLGNIGRIAASRGQGLKMKVIGADPFMTKERAAELGIELVTFDELLERADFITIHTPKTPDTEGMFNDEAFGKMKTTALLVNAARGGIVDEDALVRAIDEGKIAGAAMDVFVKEPIDPAHPFLTRDAIICSPHLGASTKEAQERVAVEIAEQLVAYLRDGEVKNALNVPALPSETAARVQPYVTVAEKIGSLIGQLGNVAGNELRVTCSGEAGELGATPIARGALAGYLSQHLEEKVNPISAPYEAKERGISLVEVKEPAGKPWASSVRATISGDEGLHTATGIVGPDGKPRLVSLDGYKLDAVLEGTIIVMRNADKPGVIGAVGTVLGKRSLNVSRMHVGLDDESGLALALYNVDGDVPSDAAAELSNLADVQSVNVVEL